MFKSKALLDSYDRNLKSIEKLHLNLDDISKDIKAFEKLLSPLCLQKNYSKVIRQSYKHQDSAQTDDYTTRHKILFCEETLEWNIEASRLEYLKYEMICFIDDCWNLQPRSAEELKVEAFGWNRKKIVFQRPLIECKVSVRSFAFRFLPHFLSSIMAECSKDPLFLTPSPCEEVEPHDDLPF